MTYKFSSQFLNRAQKGLISVCVVTRNAQEALGRFLDSIVESVGDNAPLEIIVVDNDSSDGTAEMLSKHYPHAHHIFCQPGVGFSKGINKALSISRGEFIAIATPSTEILDNAVLILLNFINQSDAIGVVGPKVLNANGTTQHSSKKMPNPKVAMIHSLYLLGIIRSSKILDEYFLLNYERDEPLQVESLTMSLMLAKRDVFEDIGFLDEDLFAWASDVDWCYRVEQSSNWQQWFVPTAKIIHRRSSVSKRQPYTNLKYYHQDLKKFYEKHYVPHYPWVFNMLWYLMLRIRFLVQLIRYSLTKESFSFY